MKKLLLAITVIVSVVSFTSCKSKNTIKYRNVKDSTVFSRNEDADGFAKGDTIKFDNSEPAVIDSIMPNVSDHEDMITYRNDETGNTYVRTEDAYGLKVGDRIKYQVREIATVIKINRVK